MLKLNRAQPFGTVTPPWNKPGTDRPAHYEQNSKLYDAHYLLIEDGVSAEDTLAKLEKPAPVQASQADDDVSDEPTGEIDYENMSVPDLIENADMMPWPAFQKQAQRVLGKQCPAKKAAIIEKLREVLAEYEARKAARMTKPAAPDQGADPRQPNQAAPTVVNKAKGRGKVDLVAWGRSQVEYLFADVRKAMRAEHSKTVDNVRDAVDFLIEQKIITAAEARKD